MLYENEAITRFAGCVEIAVVFLNFWLITFDSPIVHSLILSGLGVNIKYKEMV